MICLAGGPRARVRQAPLVGREAELELLENTYERAVRDGRAHLFTIYGDPGVGKSRLAAEFVGSLEAATILSGRALPYGEGVTYSALSDMVKTAAGIADDDPLDQALEKLKECCPDEAVADLLALASGVLERSRGSEASRRSRGQRGSGRRSSPSRSRSCSSSRTSTGRGRAARARRHMATWLREVPVMLLCLARPELLDLRPGWGGGRLRATAIELEPLGRADSEALVDALDGQLSPSAREALLGKTEGNPLFVEETIRMLAEGDGMAGGIERIPDTLQALIAARIDQLPPARGLLQCAAVIGRISGRAPSATRPGSTEVARSHDLQLREFVNREPALDLR